jgi:predicted RNA binding protein YcfA (HicA-like mRNA interferase family)
MNAGFVITRVKGSHQRLRHPDGRCTTVPVHAGQDVPRGTLRSVLQDARLTVEDLLKYLQ